MRVPRRFPRHGFCGHSVGRVGVSAGSERNVGVGRGGPRHLLAASDGRGRALKIAIGSTRMNPPPDCSRRDARGFGNYARMRRTNPPDLSLASGRRTAYRTPASVPFCQTTDTSISRAGAEKYTRNLLGRITLFRKFRRAPVSLVSSTVQSISAPGFRIATARCLTCRRCVDLCSLNARTFINPRF